MRASQCRMQGRGLAVLVSGLCLLASACSGFGPDDPRAGLSCVDDSPECVDRRQATLKSMLDDQDRKWVKEQADPQAHASGVRLFAFRSRKKELTCEELALGRREADSVPKALRGPEGKSPIAAADRASQHVRRRGQQGARRRDAVASLQGMTRACTVAFGADPACGSQGGAPRFR